MRLSLARFCGGRTLPSLDLGGLSAVLLLHCGTRAEQHDRSCGDQPRGTRVCRVPAPGPGTGGHPNEYDPDGSGLLLTLRKVITPRGDARHRHHRPDHLHLWLERRHTSLAPDVRTSCRPSRAAWWLPQRGRRGRPRRKRPRRGDRRSSCCPPRRRPSARRRSF